MFDTPVRNNHWWIYPNDHCKNSTEMEALSRLRGRGENSLKNAMLSAVVKVYECLMFEQLVAYLETLLSPYLCGLHESYNTQDLVRFIEKCKSVLDKIGSAGAILMGRSKAFDCQAQSLRRIPYLIRDKVEKAVKDLEKERIIEQVPDTQLTPWISQIVAVLKKDGAVRVCVNMCIANTAIKCVRHLVPTVEDVSYELNGAKFSKLDLSQAYYQLELDEQSRHITSFSTHVGLFQYTRLNYGTNAAAEYFPTHLTTAFTGYQGC